MIRTLRSNQESPISSGAGLIDVSLFRNNRAGAEQSCRFFYIGSIIRERFARQLVVLSGRVETEEGLFDGLAYTKSGVSPCQNEEGRQDRWCGDTAAAFLSGELFPGLGS